MQGFSLRELLAVDERKTLEFFFLGLKDVCEPNVDRNEILYNASVLAHYAQTSTVSSTDFPAPRSLEFVFDNFVNDSWFSIDAEMLETAATHCLLMAGFFEDQMRNRHNVGWYSSLGSSFFYKASLCEEKKIRAEFLKTMSRSFEPWRQRHSRLSRELRVTPYLLRMDAGKPQ